LDERNGSVPFKFVFDRDVWRWGWCDDDGVVVLINVERVWLLCRSVTGPLRREEYISPTVFIFLFLFYFFTHTTDGQALIRKRPLGNLLYVFFFPSPSFLFFYRYKSNKTIEEKKKKKPESKSFFLLFCLLFFLSNHQHLHTWKVVVWRKREANFNVLKKTKRQKVWDGEEREEKENTTAKQNNIFIFNKIM
jgi:hypothetical protein